MRPTGAKWAFGTCDGTGAAINVCLGWKPKYVKVWNGEDAGTLYPQIEWHGSFKLITAIDEGIIITGTTDADRAAVATAGISHYDGGDVLTWDASDGYWNTSAGADASEAYVDGNYYREAATDAAYRCIADMIAPNPVDGAEVTTPPGFIIGTNANMNQDGEQLCWIAVG